MLYIPPENPDQANFFSLCHPHSHPPLYKHQHTWSEFVDEGLAVAEPVDYCSIPIHTKSCVDMLAGSWTEPE